MQARAMMYKAVVQTVLLYGRRSWVVTEAMLKVLEGFHHQVDRRRVWMSAWRVWEEWCQCSSVAELFEVAGMWTLNDYIWRW